MILKNKLTKETLDIPYFEFRKKFAKEIQTAFESFKRTELNKTFYKFIHNMFTSILIISYIIHFENKKSVNNSICAQE